MNYQVIMNKDILLDFIAWLPELTPEEMYYCCLFARSKYTKDAEGKNAIPHIKSDKCQLKRFTATKDRLFSKIMQLECPLGAYTQGDIVIPQEALALYITPNPRNLWKATKNSLKHFAEVVVTEGKTMNPQADAMSEIQKAQGTKYFTVIDVDTKDMNKLAEVQSELSDGSYHTLETRGGFHLLAERALFPFSGKAYLRIEEYPNVDQMGDIMIPVPGTYQGGFIPHFIN